MHIISKTPFKLAALKYPNDAIAIMDAHTSLKKGEFKTPLELKQVFPSLDNFKFIDHMYVLDIGGNNLRLLATIYFVKQRLYVDSIVTHAEYDKRCKIETRKKPKKR